MKKLDERSTSWTSSPRELVVQSCPRIGTSYNRCVFHLLSLEVVGPFLERAAVLDAEGYGIEVLEGVRSWHLRNDDGPREPAIGAVGSRPARRGSVAPSGGLNIDPSAESGDSAWRYAKKAPRVGLYGGP